MSRCLVVGGNGFIGSHLVDHLAAAGHRVRVLDRFSAGAVYYAAQNVDRVVGDFMNVSAVEESLVGVDLVFHMLSTTTPATAQFDPLVDIRTNLTATVELMQASVRAGVRRVFFSSTGGAIYGNTRVARIGESHPTSPISPYAIGKLAAEGFFRYFSVEHGLTSTVLRISNPYGPRQHPLRPQGVIPIFLERILRGQPLTVFGDGSMVRDYIYVEDLAAMIAHIANKTPKHDLYNIGSGAGSSVLDIISTIRDVTGVSVEVEYMPKPATFVDNVVLDGTRYAEEFDCVPTTSLEKGIRRTWNHLRSRE